jgi:hypothetical protein
MCVGVFVCFWESWTDKMATNLTVIQDLNNSRNQLLSENPSENSSKVMFSINK